ncbi:exonuclease 3''-5'' domain-like 2, isoform CRA_b, partial [Mus musculus]
LQAEVVTVSQEAEWNQIQPFLKRELEDFPVLGIDCEWVLTFLRLRAVPSIILYALCDVSLKQGQSRQASSAFPVPPWLAGEFGRQSQSFVTPTDGFPKWLLCTGSLAQADIWRQNTTQDAFGYIGRWCYLKSRSGMFRRCQQASTGLWSHCQGMSGPSLPSHEAGVRFACMPGFLWGQALFMSCS